jgi:hypothetical protein
MRHVKKVSGDGSVTIYEFVADVTPSSGIPFRATIQEPGISTHFWAPNNGDQVAVLVDVERAKVKFDKDDPRVDSRAVIAAQKASFERLQNGPVDSATTGLPSRDVMRAAIQAAVDAAGRQSAHAPHEAVGDSADRLTRLESLRQQGMLTDDEYATARARIIAEL